MAQFTRKSDGLTFQAVPFTKDNWFEMQQFLGKGNMSQYALLPDSISIQTPNGFISVNSGDWLTLVNGVFSSQSEESLLASSTPIIS